MPGKGARVGGSDEGDEVAGTRRRLVRILVGETIHRGGIVAALRGGGCGHTENLEGQKEYMNIEGFGETPIGGGLRVEA